MPSICANMHQHVRHGTQHDLINGFDSWNNCFYKSARAIVRHVVPRHIWMYHTDEITKTLCSYILKLLLVKNRVEWMKGICHIWSRGRLIPPSLPVGDDWYLNLNSQKRSPGRNLGEHRSVRRSGTASRGTVVLVFCLRMRSFSRTEVHTIFPGENVRRGSFK